MQKSELAASDTHDKHKSHGGKQALLEGQEALLEHGKKPSGQGQRRGGILTLEVPFSVPMEEPRVQEGRASGDGDVMGQGARIALFSMQGWGDPDVGRSLLVSPVRYFTNRRGVWHNV